MFYVFVLFYVKFIGFWEYETNRNIFLGVLNLHNHKLFLILYYEGMYDSLEYLLGGAYW